MRRPLTLFALLVFLAGCAQPAGQPSAPTEAPSATPAARPSPTLAPGLPTPPPRITPGPTAEPFALQAGWWDSAVCYEVFVRSFYDSDGDGIGDINGLIQKLDYINDGDPASRRDLGATCIWLMPIVEAASYHGYDVVDYYTVEQDYGTNDDFKRLVAEAEARGIKIVLDLVINHTSSQHPWFQEALRDPDSPYRDWYLWSEAQPPFPNWHRSPVADEYYYGYFWSEMPDLNFRNPAVTEEVYKISRFWISEMGAAGFRMDAIKHLFEYQAVQEDYIENHVWLRDYRAFLERELPGTYTIGEIFNGNPTNLPPYYPDQLDYYFEFDVAQQTRGAADIGLASQYLRAVQAAYDTLPFQRWSPFLTNHDQVRAMSELDDDLGKAKVAALGLLTLPGMPYIYYGEEIGIVGVKPDENLRTPMQWTREEFGGFTAGVPWRPPQSDYPVKNVAAQEDDPGSLLNTYRDLVHLHVGTPALATGDFTALTANNGSVAVFLRQSGDDRVLVLINFDRAPVEGLTLDLEASGLPAGEYVLAPLYGAPESEPARLSVGSGGAVQGYTPLPVIPAQTGYILRLTPGQ